MILSFRNIYINHFNIYEVASYIVSVRKSKYLDETKYLMYWFILYFVTVMSWCRLNLMQRQSPLHFCHDAPPEVNEILIW